MPENKKVLDNIVIEGAKIIWKNFKGEVSPNNRGGERNFDVRIDDPALARLFADDGWNIKHYPKENPMFSRDEEGEFDYLPVAIRFDIEYYMPKVVLITNGRNQKMKESNIAILDDLFFENVDISIRPRPWSTVEGKSGIKAYVQTLYVTARETTDPFADKYNVDVDIPFDPD